jgi:hypothetical protein
MYLLFVSKSKNGLQAGGVQRGIESADQTQKNREAQCADGQPRRDEEEIQATRLQQLIGHGRGHPAQEEPGKPPYQPNDG